MEETLEYMISLRLEIIEQMTRKGIIEDETKKDYKEIVQLVTELDLDFKTLEQKFESRRLRENIRQKWNENWINEKQAQKSYTTELESNPEISKTVTTILETDEWFEDKRGNKIKYTIESMMREIEESDDDIEITQEELDEIKEERRRNRENWCNENIAIDEQESLNDESQTILQIEENEEIKELTTNNKNEEMNSTQRTISLAVEDVQQVKIDEEISIKSQGKVEKQEGKFRKKKKKLKKRNLNFNFKNFRKKSEIIKQIKKMKLRTVIILIAIGIGAIFGGKILAYLYKRYKIYQVNKKIQKIQSNELNPELWTKYFVLKKRISQATKKIKNQLMQTVAKVNKVACLKKQWFRRSEKEKALNEIESTSDIDINEVKGWNKEIQSIGKELSRDNGELDLEQVQKNLKQAKKFEILHDIEEIQESQFNKFTKGVLLEENNDRIIQQMYKFLQLSLIIPFDKILLGKYKDWKDENGMIDLEKVGIGYVSLPQRLMIVDRWIRSSLIKEEYDHAIVTTTRMTLLKEVLWNNWEIFTLKDLTIAYILARDQVKLGNDIRKDIIPWNRFEEEKIETFKKRMYSRTGRYIWINKKTWEKVVNLANEHNWEEYIGIETIFVREAEALRIIANDDASEYETTMYEIRKHRRRIEYLEVDIRLYKMWKINKTLMDKEFPLKINVNPKCLAPALRIFNDYNRADRRYARPWEYSFNQDSQCETRVVNPVCDMYGEETMDSEQESVNNDENKHMEKEKREIVTELLGTKEQIII